MQPKDILSLVLCKMNDESKPDTPFMVDGVIYFPGNSDISLRNARAFRDALISGVHLTKEESKTMFQIVPKNHHNYIYGVDTDGYDELKTLIKLNRNND